MTLHSWFRQEKITTIMLDNELYGNTGGQESGMTVEGQILYMAPTGKKFPKLPIYELAKTSGCSYAARVTIASPKKLAKAVKRAVLIARKIGPTYVQMFTPCPTNLKFPTDQTLKIAKEAEKNYYPFDEYITEEARIYLEEIENAKGDGKK